MTTIRVHSVPFSTNVERVALACGVKGVAVEWVRHEDADRSALRGLSGQALVPVAEFGDEIVSDSVRILERAEAETFVEWFNEVWKQPANALATNEPPEESDALRARIAGWTKRFETYLGRSAFLLGDTLTAADICAYPFLRYAVHEPDPGDDQCFHRVLHELIGPRSHPDLDRWIERMAGLPQA